MNKTIYTIGHSTHQINKFIELLHLQNIELLVDVRSYPGSKRYPQFNKEFLQNYLPTQEIKYEHLLLLGGRRPVNKNSLNTNWRHPAFRAYADYMETEDFKIGIEKLQDMAKSHNIAYMCSEAVWWKCHRSLISDYLKFNNWKVLHIMNSGKINEHPYTSAARIAYGQLSYKSEIIESNKFF